MPITLVTGTPGAGKTLFVVKELIEKLSKDGRPIYHNITGLDLVALAKMKVNPFNIFYCGDDGPYNWPEYDPGCIFIFDEVQQQYPPRNPSSKTPEYLAGLETHRKKGHDFWMITQHPSLIDNHVKRLASRHFHLYRPFGLARSTLFEWQGVNSEPNPRQSRSNAATNGFSFPKNYFKAYHSAEIHTVKARIPWRLVAIVVALFVAASGVAYMGYLSFSRMLVDRAEIHGDTLNLAEETPERINTLCFPLVARIEGVYTIRTQTGLDHVMTDELQRHYTEYTSQGRTLLCREAPQGGPDNAGS